MLQKYKNNIRLTNFLLILTTFYKKTVFFLSFYNNYLTIRKKYRIFALNHIY